MNKNVLIFGAGGHAKVVADIVWLNHDNLLGFIVDQPTEERFLGLPVLSMDQVNFSDSSIAFVVAIGDNTTRKRIVEAHPSVNWYTAIHPSAILAEDVQVGEGSMVLGGVVINTGTTVGKHTIINTGSVVEHDNRLGDYVHVSPHGTLCGKVTVGNLTWLGANTTVIPSLTIGQEIIVGAGSTVLHSLEEKGTYAGTPARKIHD